MGKFSIECPKCGGINQASTSLFAKKIIKCGSCGEGIDTRTSRMTSKICPRCNNVIVCDQAHSKGKKCPVCGESLSLTPSADYKFAKISCPGCSCSIDVDKTKKIAHCPICDYEINVDKEIARLHLVDDANISVIQYEGDNDTFIWKHPIEDFNYGTQLIVHESQEAIFFLNGEALDSFGPGRHTLETENIPMLRKIYSTADSKQTPFHTEVYFINKTVQMGIKWGTDSRVKFIDPITGIPLDIGAFGELNLQVENSRELLIKLVGTMNGIDWSGKTAGFSKSLQNAFRAPISTQIKTYLANVIKDEKINILEIDTHLSEFSEALRAKITPFFKEYGLSVPQLYVTAVSLPEEDKNFKQIKELISQAYLGVNSEKVRADIARAEQQRKIIEAQTQAQLELIRAQGQAEAAKMTGFAEAEIMRAQGYTHKDELELEAKKAYAEGLGNFGANGGGSSGGSASADIVGMMMGLKMAGAMSEQFEKNIVSPNANVSNGNGNQTVQAQPVPQGQPVPQTVRADLTGWNCSCGMKNISSKFCPECGSPRPVINQSWDCTCGTQGITSKFCPNCGSKRPE